MDSPNTEAPAQIMISRDHFHVPYSGRHIRCRPYDCFPSICLPPLREKEEKRDSGGADGQRELMGVAIFSFLALA
ncbi:MAG: hypothetical protein QM296_08770, partial [Bacillota bacterium]|nr:hypothetical protein [Bacillota bacterium]